MYKITFYGYDRPLVIECDTYLDALNERNLRAGMGLVCEITRLDSALKPAAANRKR